MNPEYPIFIPTKGRHKTPLTIRALQRIKVPFKIVVEAQEYDDYQPLVRADDIIVLPHRDKGLTVTRNWIWDYAQHELKMPYFWTMDDNIREFYRLNHNIKARVTSGTFLRVIEDFAQRFENLAICGMAYEMFVPRKQKSPPFVMNTRIYSNMLIRTDIPYRNVTFFNDDTDLCLRVLKDGWCTVELCAFLADKAATMSIKGGMTDYYEKTERRKQFAEELVRAHPDVVKIVWRYNRWHHQVDYRPFRNNRLRLKPGVVVPGGPNEYGMVLVKNGEPVLVTDECQF